MGNQNSCIDVQLSNSPADDEESVVVSEALDISESVSSPVHPPRALVVSPPVDVNLYRSYAADSVYLNRGVGTFTFSPRLHCSWQLTYFILLEPLSPCAVRTLALADRVSSTMLFLVSFDLFSLVITNLPLQVHSQFRVLAPSRTQRNPTSLRPSQSTSFHPGTGHCTPNKRLILLCPSIVGSSTSHTALF